MDVFNKIYEAILEGKYTEIGEYIENALKESIPVNEIVDKALLKGMIEVGDKFGKGELYIPDMFLAAKTMKEAMRLLNPYLKSDENIQEKATIIIGSVKGDLHDIGKNLVITMAESQGFNVIDLGIDVGYDVFVDAIKKYKPVIVAFSGLLTTTLANIPDHIKAIEDADLRDKVVLAVGGAPVTRDFADMYGIEIYAEDASSAAKEFKKIVAK